MGIGVVDCEDIQLGNLAMRAVGEWVKSRMTTNAWYRRAAALRKERGFYGLLATASPMGCNCLVCQQGKTTA